MFLNSPEPLLITSLPAAFICTGLCMAIVWRNPELGLAALLAAGRFLMAIKVHFGGFPVSIYMAHAVGGVLLLWTSLRLLKGNVLPGLWREMLVVAFVFFWADVIGTYFLVGAREGGIGISRLRYFLFADIIPVFCLIGLLRDRTSMFRVLKYALFILLGIQAYMFVGVFMMMQAGISGLKLRYMMIHGIPVFAAGNVLFIILCGSFYFSPGMSRKLKTLSMLGLFMGMILLVVAQSRSAIAGGLLSITLIFLQYRKFPRRVMLKVFLLSAFGLGVLFAFGNMRQILTEVISLRWHKTVETDLIESSSGRTALWGQALESFKSSPWTGVGIGNSTEPIYFPVATGFSADPYRPGVHNFLLAVMAENGLVGLLIFLIFTGVAVCMVLKTSSNDFLDDRSRLSWVILKTAFLFSAANTLVGGPDYLFWSAVAALILLRHNRHFLQDRMPRAQEMNLGRGLAI